MFLLEGGLVADLLQLSYDGVDELTDQFFKNVRVLLNVAEECLDDDVSHWFSLFEVFAYLLQDFLQCAATTKVTFAVTPLHNPNQLAVPVEYRTARHAGNVGDSI